VVSDLFDYWESELTGVPASNIWNYDETNFIDDPVINTDVK
jgi:hypothetical protein